MTDEASPSLLSRVCCCYNKPSKQPNVELIRTNSLADRNISTATESVDGFEDINLELRVPPATAVEKPKPSPRNVKQENKDDEFVLNDIMMDEICKKETDNDEHVIEDVVSISTNVIEEVDDEELKAITAQTSEEPKPAAIQEKPEPERRESETGRSSEVVTFHQMLEEGYMGTTPREPSPESPSARSADVRSADVAAVLSARDADSDSEDEIMIEEEQVLPPPPPPAQLRSTMYGDLASDEEEESDDEDREVLPPVSPKRMDDINADDVTPRENDKDHVFNETQSNGPLPESAASKVDDVEDSEQDDSGSEKENDGVTRLSVKSDGTAAVANGTVRVALDSREMTDDEFSEKLI